jgi:hypothetical protein
MGKGHKYNIKIHWHTYCSPFKRTLNGEDKKIKREGVMVTQ